MRLSSLIEGLAFTPERILAMIQAAVEHFGEGAFLAGNCPVLADALARILGPENCEYVCAWDVTHYEGMAHVALKYDGRLYDEYGETTMERMADWSLSTYQDDPAHYHLNLPDPEDPYEADAPEPEVTEHVVDDGMTEVLYKCADACSTDPDEVEAFMREWL